MRFVSSLGLLVLVGFGCGSTSREPKARRQDGATSAGSALADAAPANAAALDAAVSDAARAGAAPESSFEQSSGDPVSAPRVIPKHKLTAADKALLAFARTCAEKKRDAGSTNIDVESGRLSRVDTRVWVTFAEKKATPTGEYTLDVSDTKRGCIWIPRE